METPRTSTRARSVVPTPTASASLKVLSQSRNGGAPRPARGSKPAMENLAAPGTGRLIGLMLAGIVAVDRGGRGAEDVLERQRDAAGGVVLQLGHAYEDVGILVGVVQIVCRIHIAALRHFEPA